MFKAILESPLFLYLTQSVWRDEAYSILIAQKPIFTYLKLSFEPPLYYTILHFWIKLFGTSEIAVRSLSFISFCISVYAVWLVSKKLFKSDWLTWFLPLFYFINPMLLYYAFEARAYGMYMAFTMLSTYFYLEKKWLWYVCFTALGLYTHAYMVFVVFIQIVHFGMFEISLHKLSLRTLYTNSFIRACIALCVLFIPWTVKMIIDIPRLTQSWYYPVDSQLFKSALGNIFLGYEGTPWNLWIFTQRVSIIIAVLTMAGAIVRRNKSSTWYFFLLLYVPLFTILCISLVKPLYVMRYLIPSTIAEIFLIAIFIQGIHHHVFKKIVAVAILVTTCSFSIWYAPYHKKIDMKNTLRQINALQSASDVIMVDDALIIYEAMYYNTSNSSVYWYNPNNYSFPWYIGDYIIRSSQIVREFPEYPKRAFFIHQNGNYEIMYRTPISSHGSISPLNKK